MRLHGFATHWRHGWGLGVVVGATVLGVASPALAANPSGCPTADSGSPTSCLWTTPGTQTFTVPSNVDRIDIIAGGAAGGTGHFYSPGGTGQPAVSVPGGAGASVEDSSVPVVPGQTLTVTIGGQGGSLGGCPGEPTTCRGGGAPGGSPGNGGNGFADNYDLASGGGGGFSGVSAGSTPLVVAGGGGGGGAPLRQGGTGGAGDQTGAGGHAGNVASDPGVSGSIIAAAGQGGQGGVGGAGGAGAQDCTFNQVSGGGAGSSRAGGNAADGGGDGGSGGGGGGGYGGGGAGGSGCDTGGGGGGGSYGATGLTGGSANSGAGNVSIAWSEGPSYLRSFGSAGSADGHLSAPAGVAVDSSNGLVYVADEGNSRIDIFTLGGSFVMSIPTDGEPYGIAADFSLGYLYVTEPSQTGQLQVHVIATNGTSDDPVSFFPGDAQSLSTGIAVDPGLGRVYVADSGDNVIDEYDESGNYQGSFGDSSAGLVDPSGVAVDPTTDDVYVVDAGNNRVVRFDSSGAVLGTVGSSGSGTGQFTQPNEATFANGQLFVTDDGNNRLQSFTPAGQLTGFWGGAGTGFGQFSTPVGIAFASDGSFFVADAGNNRIERFGIPGPVSQYVIRLSSNLTAGTAAPVSITPEDAAGNVIMDYFGSPSWHDVSGQLSGSPAAFSQGLSRNSVTFAKAAHADHITVTDGSVSSTSGTFAVLGPLAKFVISGPASGTAGTPASVSIAAEDSAGNTLTHYAGTPSWSDLSGQLSGHPAAFVNGHSTNSVTFAHAVDDDHITVTDGSVSTRDAFFNMIGPLAKFVVTGPASGSVGSTRTVSVAAEDSAGNVLTAYSGSPSWGDVSGQISGHPAAFTNGRSANSVSFTNAVRGDHITVTDGSVSSRDASFNMIGPLGGFTLRAPSAMGTGTPFTLTLTAVDRAGNVLTGYAGAPTWGDGSGQLTGSPDTFSNGVSQTAVTFARPVAGDVITVVDGSVSTAEPGINVVGPFAKFVIHVPTSATHGVGFPVTVYAEDAAGNRVRSYAHTPAWGDSSGQLLGQPAAFSNGVSTNTVTLANRVASDRIRVVDGSISVLSAAFPVN